MKYTFSFLVFLLFFSCKNAKEEYHSPESSLDAGREFIEQSLKGKFDAASKYMLQDEDNQFWLTKWSKEFSNLSEQERAGYNKATITIYEVNDVVPDSVTIINYSNSYKNRPLKLKVVKVNGEWKVDFKYTFPVIFNPCAFFQPEGALITSEIEPQSCNIAVLRTLLPFYF